jgi:hypothetical protein
MYEGTEPDEYLAEIRVQVCSRCVERPPGGPPCEPLGNRCGVELNLRQLVDAVQKDHVNWMEPYIEHFHEDVCAHCDFRQSEQCPRALEYLLELAVEAIETVDERRSNTESPN